MGLGSNAVKRGGWGSSRRTLAADHAEQARRSKRALTLDNAEQVRFELREPVRFAALALLPGWPVARVAPTAEAEVAKAEVAEAMAEGAQLRRLLAAIVRAGQRQSAEWKGRWATNPNPNPDPNPNPTPTPTPTPAPTPTPTPNQVGGALHRRRARVRAAHRAGHQRCRRGA